MVTWRHTVSGGWAAGSPSVCDLTLGEGDGERERENYNDLSIYPTLSYSIVFYLLYDIWISSCIHAPPWT